MFNSDDQRKDRRNRSLLSGAGRGPAPARPRGGSLLSARPVRQPDPAPQAPPRPAQPRKPHAPAPAGRLEKTRTADQRPGLVARIRDAAARLAPASPPVREPPYEAPRRGERQEEPRRPEPHRRDWNADHARPDQDDYWRPLIDPMSVVSGIVRAKWLIVLTTILGAILGVIVALSTPKQYYAQTELLFDPRDLQLVDRDLTRDGLPSDATLALIENQVSIIRSGSVLNKVVERLGLADDPEFNGQGGGGFALPGPRALLGGRGDGGEAGASLRRSLAVQNLAESLEVGRDAKTFIIYIGATTRDPEKSARIATATAEAFLETSANMQSDTAQRANDEITGRLDELRRQVEEAEQAVADFKRENDIVDAQGRLITDDEIVRLNEQLSTARARTAELNARAASTRDLELGDILGGSLPEQVASPVMTELLTRYATLQQQADRAAARLGPRHPDNQTVQAELAGVREAIARELNRVASSIQVELQRAVRLEQDLAARLARLKAEQGDLANEQVRLRELEREAAARRAVYESFLLRARETGQQRNLNSANVSIISEAYPPLLPTGASRASIAIAGTILGFLAGVALGAGMGAIGSLRENMRERRRNDGNGGGQSAGWPEDDDPMPPGPRRDGRPFAPSAEPSASPSPAMRAATNSAPSAVGESLPQQPDPAVPAQPLAQPQHDQAPPPPVTMPVQGWPAPMMPMMPYPVPYQPMPMAWHAPQHFYPQFMPPMHPGWPQQAAPAPANDARPSPEPEPASAIDRIRRSLREFRDEVDAVARNRRSA